MTKPRFTYTATNPATGEEVTKTTTRTNITFAVFMPWERDGETVYATTWSSAADVTGAVRAAKSSQPYLTTAYVAETHRH